MKKLQWLMAPLAVFVMTFGASCGGNNDDCGNKVVDEGEQCDDGNNVNDDACTNECKLAPSVCGNGKVEGAEICDDGNVTDGDGCSQDCLRQEKTETFSQSNLNLGIADNAYDGSVGEPSMSCAVVEVPDDGFNTIVGVELGIGIDHPYIGDLVLKLKSPDKTVVTLLNRPGYAEPADDGSDADISHEDSYLSSENVITFKNGGATDAEVMGSTINTDQYVCKDDGLCEYAPNPGSAESGDFSKLFGKSSAGTWTICAGDSALNGEGSLQSIALKLTRKFSK